MAFNFPTGYLGLMAGMVVSGLLLRPCIWAYSQVPKWVGLPLLLIPWAAMLATLVWYRWRVRHG